MRIAYRYLNEVSRPVARIYMPETQMVLPADHHFRIDNYKKLIDDTAASWDDIFGLVNTFFRGLPEAKRRAIGAFYLEAHSIAQSPQTSPDDYDTVLVDAHYLGVIFCDLIESTDLVEELSKFVYKRNAVKVPQFVLDNLTMDDPLRIFGFHDYHELLIINLLCKLLCPVWGQLMIRQDGYIEVGVLNKHIVCFQVLGPVLTCTFSDIFAKLQTYMHAEVDDLLSGDTYKDHPFFETVDQSELKQAVVNAILVKHYVNANLHNPHMELVFWTSSRTHMNTTAMLETLKKRWEMFNPSPVKVGETEYQVTAMNAENSGPPIENDD